MMYWRELRVAWGESDPFGLVYFPRMLALFNDTEHELFRTLGYPIDKMISEDRTTFVMGEINFRFIGPAAYGDRVTLWIELEDLRAKTLHWVCRARRSEDRAPVMEGRATRVYAHINEDGTLKSAVIPDEMRRSLLSPDVGLTPEEGPRGGAGKPD
jgi:YbgC/YbaW family acyl-CoA thioester hydrolase